MTTLGLNRVGIADLSPLSGLTAMQLFTAAGNGVTDLTPLSGMTGLMVLNVEQNEIESLAPLSGLSSISYLRFGSNRVESLEPIAGLSRLYHLSAEQNRIRSIAPLAGMALTGRGEVTEQRVALDPIRLGQHQGSPLGGLDGAPVAGLRSDAAVIDADGASGWRLDAPGTDLAVRWSVAGDPSAGTPAFSGTVTQSALAPITVSVTDPADVAVVAGTPATFSVEIGASEGAASVRWERSETGGSSWAPIDGATSATLTLAETRLAQDGHRFRAVVTSTLAPEATRISAAAQLTVTEDTAAGPPRPGLTPPPGHGTPPGQLPLSGATAPWGAALLGALLLSAGLLLSGRGAGRFARRG